MLKDAGHHNGKPSWQETDHLRDGTWNTEDGTGWPTNVVKIRRALQNKYVEGVRQWICYVTGVGTRFRERIRGGAFGYGLSKNILEAYRFLVEHYEEGSKLYFFGFSRGAYTVRSLAGLVRNSGVLRKSEIGRIDEAFSLYRNRARETNAKSSMATAFKQKYSHETDIEFIGVWDTVGSLGIPLPGLRLFGLLSRIINKDFQFHDTELSSKVKNAFHAVSIHERRGTFAPTLWTQQDAVPGQVLEQVWFPGVHCDVGGGYRSISLSDSSLKWMIDKAQKCGLRFREDALIPGANMAPEPLGQLHNSYAFPFNVIDWCTWRFRGAPRQFREKPATCESISDAARFRFRHGSEDKWPPSFRGVLGD